MEFKKAKQAIINFAENVVKQSKQNLVKQDKKRMENFRNPSLINLDKLEDPSLLRSTYS